MSLLLRNSAFFFILLGELCFRLNLTSISKLKIDLGKSRVNGNRRGKTNKGLACEWEGVYGGRYHYVPKSAYMKYMKLV